MREALARTHPLTAPACPVATPARSREPAAANIPQVNFALLGARMASLIGLIAMAALPAEFYITVTTSVTVAGSVILQILVMRENRRRYERTRQENIDRYEHDRQERIDHQDELKLEIARVAALTRATATSLKDDIHANTMLTVEAGAKADAAYDAANHVNEKIANLRGGGPPAQSP